MDKILSPFPLSNQMSSFPGMTEHVGPPQCWLCRSFGHLTCVLQHTAVQRLSIAAGITSCAQWHRFQHPLDTHFNGSAGQWVKKGVLPVGVGSWKCKINSGYSTRRYCLLSYHVHIFQTTKQLFLCLKSSCSRRDIDILPHHQNEQEIVNFSRRCGWCIIRPLEN